MAAGDYVKVTQDRRHQRPMLRTVLKLSRPISEHWFDERTAVFETSGRPRGIEATDRTHQLCLNQAREVAQPRTRRCAVQPLNA